MTRAIEMGADVVGGIPHYENTRDKGVSSVMFLMDLAQRHGCLVDVHCDETDDPQSRFLEVLAEEARVRGMGAQVTASHTCAMGSYDNAYCSKLFRLLKAVFADKIRACKMTQKYGGAEGQTDHHYKPDEQAVIFDKIHL